MIAIIDYGVGNIFSLCSSFGAIGEEAVLTGDAAVVRSADKLILPGVGAFGDAAEKLRSCGLWDVILEEAAKLVVPGGTLIYSTCTIHKKENMDNVHWFLQENADFELVSIGDILCDELKKDVVEEGCLQFLPGVHESDGFFIAKFKRVQHG